VLFNISIQETSSIETSSLTIYWLTNTMKLRLSISDLQLSVEKESSCHKIAEHFSTWILIWSRRGHIMGNARIFGLLELCYLCCLQVKLLSQLNLRMIWWGKYRQRSMLSLLISVKLSKIRGKWFLTMPRAWLGRSLSLMPSWEYLRSRCLEIYGWMRLM